MTPEPGQFRTYRRTIYRVVEAQHRRSTERLLADLAEQDILESLIEQAKPRIPPAAQGLHHLLATPFRYGYRSETRFRRAGERPGAFYASEKVETAIAETAYWQMRFLAAAPEAIPPRAILEFWAFSIPVSVRRALDLSRPPLASREREWRNPADYSACQDFAGQARRIGAQLIRYRAVRDPARGFNVVLFDPAAFRAPVPGDAGTWHLRFTDDKLIAEAAFPSAVRFVFSFDQFALRAPGAARS